MSRQAAELRALSDGDLQERLEETHRQLFTLRFQVATRQAANHRALRDARRRIGRIRTLQRERELSVEVSSTAAAPVAAAPVTDTPADEAKPKRTRAKAQADAPAKDATPKRTRAKKQEG